VRYLWLTVVCVLLAGCHKEPRRTSTPVAPAPAIDYFGKGEQAFKSGDYSGAVQAFERYLERNPEAEDRDYVMFRLAMSLALEGSPAYDPQRSTQVLKELSVQHPESPWVVPAQMILDLKSQLQQQDAVIAQTEARTAQLSAELAAANRQEAEWRAQLQQLEQTTTQESKQKEMKLRQLRASLEETTQRIRKLTAELEALKKIDLQRRPSRPPQR
jgi:outer membrane protein assembly factor BamD (BamD/ComL family)